MIKLSKKLISVFLAIILIFSVCSMEFSVFAATSEQQKIVLLDTQKGTLGKDKFKRFNFTVPVDGKVVICFDDYLYCDLLLKIKDKNGDEVYRKSVSLGYSAYNYSKTLKAGKYTLVIVNDDYSSSDYNFTIKEITDQKIPATAIKFKKSEIELKSGKKTTLKPTLSPSYSTDTLSWSSSNENVAKVSQKGVVSAIYLGEATIRATNGKKSGKCVVRVNQIITEVAIGNNKSLTAFIKYVKNKQGGKWSSSDTSVATIDSYGTVYPKNVGNTIISFTAADGKVYKITLVCLKNLTVTPYVNAGFVAFYPDYDLQARFFFRNKSSKDITYMEFDIAQYDYRGYKLQSPYDWYYYDEEILHAKQHTPIYFEVNQYTRYAKITITGVWFADGTVWKP